jgi:hypothetical protein
MNVQAGIGASAPQAGDLQKMTTVEAYVPDDAIGILADAGVPIVAGTHYQVLRVRSWYFPDGGFDTGPNWPSDVLMLQQSGPTLCSSSTICTAYSQGAVDTALSGVSSCACAIDSSCIGTSPDGGNLPVPLGVTIPAAGWTGPLTGNCQIKPCGDLWTYLPDGGEDTSWPTACPANL